MYNNNQQAMQMFNEITPNEIHDFSTSILSTDLTQVMSIITITSFIAIILFLVVVSSNDANIHIDTLKQ